MAMDAFYNSMIGIGKCHGKSWHIQNPWFDAMVVQIRPVIEFELIPMPTGPMPTRRKPLNHPRPDLFIGSCFYESTRIPYKTNSFQVTGIHLIIWPQEGPWWFQLSIPWILFSTPFSNAKTELTTAILRLEQARGCRVRVKGRLPTGLTVEPPKYVMINEWWVII